MANGSRGNVDMSVGILALVGGGLAVALLVVIAVLLFRRND